MKQIKLTQDKVALVSDGDYEFLSQWKWYFNNGYAVRQERKNGVRRRIYMHRVILDVPEGKMTDHKDNNRLNNTRENLRIVSSKENRRNTYAPRGTSKYLGVCKRKRLSNKWFATININGSSKDLGIFDKEIDAAMAYDNAALSAYGEFARLNFPKKEGDYHHNPRRNERAQ